MTSDNNRPRWRRWLGALLVLVGLMIVLRWQFRPAQPQSKISRPELEQPVYGDSHGSDPNDGMQAKASAAERPLTVSDLLDVAHQLKTKMEKNLTDYTAQLIKRERIHGKLRDEDFMQVKIRNALPDSQPPKPFAVYIRFVAPSKSDGREVIWVEGENDGKLLTHEFGLKLSLPPNGLLAMNGNRYPITDIGMVLLAEKLIEKGERDRNAPNCKVEVIDNQLVGDRPCKLLQITHPEKLPGLDYHVAQIFIDNQLDLPIRYASYSWPPEPGTPPQLEEEYTYLDLKINVGLTDRDFDTSNPEYKYPK